MAEDNGTGAVAAAGAFGAVPFFGAAGAVAAAAQNLLVELSEMDNFKNRVDELLKELNKSPAAHNKVAEDRLTQSNLGGAGFKEAEFLYASYNLVHDELENLSKVLGLQIESMQLAIRASQTGYSKIDDDIKERMRRLNAEIAEHYDRDRDPNAGVSDKPHGVPKSQPTHAEAAGQAKVS
ncbi:hypothetical protein OG735_16290 [Streptomyces sp. NBC_01210]|uniref:hypothetical protein n=1 Tax=Streptomyces sp. NBC_01210 TaxID=2903774 RepID=UPI002E13400B|nr:hypothetical protein OG735_16290 [Streptomyces sp. NBC_01210]